jgi:hypothetical protein
MEINFEALVNALQEQQIVDNNPKVFIVWWSNGEPWREDEIVRILEIFSSREKADSYITEWREKSKRECDEINQKRRLKGYGDMEFSENVWIET